MKNNPRLLLSLLALVLVFGGAWAALYLAPSEPNFGPEPEASAPEASSPQDPSESQPAESEPVEPEPFAPDFVMTDAEGNAVRLSDFRGKPVLLNFWASWCGPCQIEMPYFDAVYTEEGDTVTLLMVNLEDAKTAQKFMEENEYSFPYYIDDKMEGAVAYSVVSIPRTYAIDAEGYLVESYIGTMNDKQLGRMIDNLLAS
jgi:cytochrome c biogenesis protein CcmG/thiol:disulfide interchange protein DsbE